MLPVIFLCCLSFVLGPIGVWLLGLGNTAYAEEDKYLGIGVGVFFLIWSALFGFMGLLSMGNYLFPAVH